MQNLTTLPFKLLGAALLSFNNAVATPLPPHVAAAAVRTIESEYVSVVGKSEAQFLRYDVTGKLEAFQCSSITTLTFSLFQSSAGDISVGLCSKDALLDENMGDQQVRGFEAAVASAGGGIDSARKSLGNSVKPQIIREGGNVFIHLSQWLISGVGGADGHGAAIVETALMIPPNSKTVVLVQGGISQNGCQSGASSPNVPLCADFRGVMREVLRQVYTAQASPPPPRAFILEPLRPGQPTICDSIAHVAGKALEESDTKQIPVTETIKYKQHSGQSYIQDGMRQAADDHAKGASISAAATRVGRQCYEKTFSNQ